MNFSKSFLQMTIVIAGTAILSGCAHSPKNWRERTPTLEKVTDKSVETVINCVSEYWQSKGATPNYLPRASGATILLALPGIVGPTGATLAMLDVDRTENGSLVRYYALKSIWSKANANEKARIATCL